MNVLRVIFPVALLVLVGVFATPVTQAARVNDLYSASVPLDSSSRDPLNDAFGRALGEVLVKVTAKPDIGADAARVGLFPNPASLVQQYQRLPDQQLQASFDPRAVRAGLDGAGLPVWGEVRPLVSIWLAVDSGGGRRVLVAAGAGGAADNEPADLARAELLAAADSRGLPVVVPLVDAQDLAVVNFADVWGDFPGPVLSASARYGADIALIGRARSMNPADDRTRWTLHSGNEKQTWTGDLASGPARAAEYLGQRLATFADASGALRLVVQNVDSLKKYGELRAYFASLNVVERATVGRVNGAEVEFELVVRGDAARLQRELSGSSLLQPADIPALPAESGRRPDLVYTWAADT